MLMLIINVSIYLNVKVVSWTVTSATNELSDEYQTLLLVDLVQEQIDAKRRD